MTSKALQTFCVNICAKQITKTSKPKYIFSSVNLVKMLHLVSIPFVVFSQFTPPNYITSLNSFRYQGGKFPKKQKGFEAHRQADVSGAKETFFIAAA